MSPHRKDDHHYDVWGQDTYRPREEEYFAAEMGQPSDVPRFEHEPWKETYRRNRVSGLNHEQAVAATDRSLSAKRYEHRPAVLAQTPVRCGKCERLAEEFVDTIVLVDGVWFHEDCVP